MTNDNEKIQYAQQLIELARSEETEDGNPLTAARNYITAMEIVASIAGQHAAHMDNIDQRRLFLFQIRNRLEVYYERAELLLQVAAETGLLDKPATSGGLQAALPSSGLPPPLYNGSNNNGGGGGQNGGASAVLGIPVHTSAMAGGAGDQNSSGYYLAPDDGSTAARPPGPPLDLDALMKDLGAS